MTTLYLVDYHTHSKCSPDSNARLSDMVQAARRAGLKELCTTDHCDLMREDGSPLEHWDWTPILNQFDAVQHSMHRPGFRISLGLELGAAATAPQKARGILEGAPLDFVIGSVHNLSPRLGGQDFFYLDYTNPDFCRAALEDYVSSLLALAPLPYYDALGHIIYPLRYINGRAGHQMTLEPWNDQLDEVLRAVIHAGHAIEVNTHGGREVEDWLPILRRYHELGGELITLGSDAHRPAYVGRGLIRAAELMREAGFRYLTLYRSRKPEPIKL